MLVAKFNGRSAPREEDAEHELAIRWILRLRWGTVIAEAATVLVAAFVLQIPLETAHIAAVIAVTASSNAALHFWRRGNRPLPRFAVGALLLGDTALLTTLLYLSGGPSNPFTSLYLVYVTLAALALGMRWASALVVAAAAGYGGLFFAHVPVCVLDHDHHGDAGLPLHLQMMWVAFLVTGTIVAYFVSCLARSLRERDAALALAQRVATRNENLLSLSTLAAGAAHELGTPLATIAVATRELERTGMREGSASDNLRLIRDAVDRCRHIVLQMGGRSAEGLGEVPQPASIQAVLVELRERATVGCASPFSVDIHPLVPAEVSVPREGLVQALTSLVRNAIDASAPGGRVQVRVLVEQRSLRFDVEDEGVGIASEVLRRLGEPFFTTKPVGHGMGLGLFLARAFAERWNGRLSIDSAIGRGTRASLEIPVGETP